MIQIQVHVWFNLQVSHNQEKIFDQANYEHELIRKKKI